MQLSCQVLAYRDKTTGFPLYHNQNKKQIKNKIKVAKKGREGRKKKEGKNKRRERWRKGGREGAGSN